MQILWQLNPTQLLWYRPQVGYIHVCIDTVLNYVIAAHANLHLQLSSRRSLVLSTSSHGTSLLSVKLLQQVVQRAHALCTIIALHITFFASSGPQQLTHQGCQEIHQGFFQPSITMGYSGCRATLFPQFPHQVWTMPSECLGCTRTWQ